MERIGKLAEPGGWAPTERKGVDSVYIIQGAPLCFRKNSRKGPASEEMGWYSEPLAATLAARTADPRAPEFLCAGGIR
jgi:hypothetical protein